MGDKDLGIVLEQGRMIVALRRELSAERAKVALLEAALANRDVGVLKQVRRATVTREALTGQQEAVLAFCISFNQDNGVPPTVREIANRMGMRSTNAVSEHLARLEKKGYLVRLPLKSRNIRVLVDLDPPEVVEP